MTKTFADVIKTVIFLKTLKSQKVSKRQYIRRFKDMKPRVLSTVSKKYITMWTVSYCKVTFALVTYNTQV